MKLIVLIVIAIIIYIYVSYYYRTPDNISILQSRLNEFDFSLLNEKQPIIIEDRLKDSNELSKLWFKWNQIKTFGGYDDNKWYKNKYKYILVHPENDTDILLYPAGKNLVNNEPDPEEQLIIIKLKANQLLIIPYHWHFMIETKNNINFIGIHDLLTRFLL